MGPDRDGTTGEAAVAHADRLAACGRCLEAIDLLEGIDRGDRSAGVERRLRDLRLAAFAEVCDGQPPRPWAEEVPFTPTLRDGLPVVPAADLDASVIRTGILRHGCVRVPDLVPRSRCGELREAIDRTFDAVAGGPDGRQEQGWYDPFTPPGPAPPGPPLERQRQRAAKAGSLWSVDSPRMLQAVCDLVRDVGLRDVIEAYLGERPVMSATKSNLRRVPLDAVYADWHQDGAFLGTGIRTLNLWVTLTDCGVDAPGMDVVPRRLDRIVETGTDGAIFDWAVSPARAAEAAGEAGIVRPVFRAGEALLFDELFLHRTACEEGMTTPRHALEHWFFASSSYPGRQIPVVL